MPVADSLPALQCPAENGITVVWTVNQPAAALIQYGTDKEHLDQTAYGGQFGLRTYSRRFLQIRLTGLKPNTRYFYRTVTRPFTFVNAYTFRQKEPAAGEIFSFETSGENKPAGTFSVINDTHGKQSVLKMLGGHLQKINADYTIWNGDLVDQYDNESMAVNTILKPGGGAFAAEKPLLFIPGNHDYRGEWARNLPQCLAVWEHPAAEDRAMGRNFVVRTGPLALIGLDTGEDKPDNRKEWGGLAGFEPYRTAQRDWLERALQSPAVKTAKFAVAFCHIPVFDARPNANGGDLPEGFADFQRQCGDLWGPLLTKYGVQAVITAHTHRFRYDAPAAGRTWAQITGGGNHLERSDITVIHGKAEGGKLEITADSVNKGTVLGKWTFAARG
jgi:hypothetical protein